MKLKLANNNIALIVIVVLLVVSPLVVNKSAEYGGADGQAEEVITEISPDYKPWFSSLYEPASGEIESLLFVTQGAIGAGVIGYCLGYIKGKNNNDSNR